MRTCQQIHAHMYRAHTHAHNTHTSATSSGSSASAPKSPPASPSSEAAPPPIPVSLPKRSNSVGGRRLSRAGGPAQQRMGSAHWVSRVEWQWPRAQQRVKRQCPLEQLRVERQCPLGKQGVKNGSQHIMSYITGMLSASNRPQHWPAAPPAKMGCA